MNPSLYARQPRNIVSWWKSIHLSLSTASHVSTRKSSTLTRLIQDTIKISGPIRVSDYMKYALYHPTEGYYMRNRAALSATIEQKTQQDPIEQPISFVSAQGDFITSPEVSQLFGEMMAIYLVAQYRSLAPQLPPLHLIELGPGNATLLVDLLRVFCSFPDVLRSLKSISLVEVCPALRERQKQTLLNFASSKSLELTFEDSISPLNTDTLNRIHIRWFDRVDDLIQNECNFIIAHEFFDALPIRQFQKKSARDWHEILIDLEEQATSKTPFRCVLKENPDPMSELLNQRHPNSPIDAILEISQESVQAYQKIISLMGSQGLCLIADYGYQTPSFRNSLRGIKAHQFYEIYHLPGQVDLSSDVDFGLFLEMAKEASMHVGDRFLMGQNVFLSKMGIEARYRQLSSQMKGATEAQRVSLLKGFERLKEMGSAYQMLLLLPRSIPSAISFKG